MISMTSHTIVISCFWRTLASLHWFRLAVSVTLSSGGTNLASRRTASPSSTIASWICGGYVLCFKSPCVIVAPLVCFCPRPVAWPFYKKQRAFSRKQAPRTRIPRFSGVFRHSPTDGATYMLSGTHRSFQRRILRQRTGISPFFGTPRGKPVWKVPSFRGFRGLEKNLVSPLLGRLFLSPISQIHLWPCVFSFATQE